MHLLNIKYAICQNGSLIVDDEGNVIKNITLNKEQVTKIVDITRQQRLGFTINSEFLIYSNY